MVRVVMATMAAVLTAGCSMFGDRSGTEQLTYTVSETLGESVEIRRYPPLLVAETVVAAADAESSRNPAFRALFDYISGENRTQTKVAMTAPVETASRPREIAMTAPVETATTGDGRYAMRFFLPAEFTADTAPEPLNPNVRLVDTPERTLAVLRFSGSTSEEAVARRLQELQTALAGSRWQPVGEPTALFYDPPWTLPFLRRNEVAVPVTEG